MKKIAQAAAVSAALALALAAGAAPVASFTYTNVNSNPVATQVVFNETVTATDQVVRVELSGTLTEVNLTTWGQEALIDVQAPDFQVISIAAFPTTFGFTGSLTATSLSFDFDFPVASAAGGWSFTFYEDFDDAGDGLTDARWDTITLTLDSGAAPPPPPPPPPPACATGLESFTFTNLTGEGEEADPGNSIVNFSPTSSALAGGIQVTGQLGPTGFADEALLLITRPSGEVLGIIPSPVAGAQTFVDIPASENVIAGFAVPAAANSGVWSVEIADTFDDPGVDNTWTQLCLTLIEAPAGTWYELEPTQGGADAGDALTTAQSPSATTAIVGTFTASDADIYAIDICDPSAFVAEVNTAGLSPDTGLFLFDSNGLGVTFNDDTPIVPLDLRSRITGTFITAPGTYFLAISRFDRDPVDAGGLALWLDTPFAVERAPDGPGAANPLAAWAATTVAYPFYEILLTGASPAGTCGGSTCPACPADFDQDGGVTGADVEAFFLAFEAGDTCGDTDLDGGVTGADVEAFFIAFEAGGC
jgi:hypothetical protein